MPTHSLLYRPSPQTWSEQLFPIWRQLEINPNRIVRCLLARLPPGFEITTHHDTGLWATRTHRCHVPVITNPDLVEFCVGADEESLLRIPMREGTAVELNNRAKHRVHNKWDKHRVHLIFDYADESVEMPLGSCLSSGPYQIRSPAAGGDGDGKLFPLLLQTRRTLRVVDGRDDSGDRSASGDSASAAAAAAAADAPAAALCGMPPSVLRAAGHPPGNAATTPETQWTWDALLEEFEACSRVRPGNRSWHQNRKVAAAAAAEAEAKLKSASTSVSASGESKGDEGAASALTAFHAASTRWEKGEASCALTRAAM